MNRDAIRFQRVHPRLHFWLTHRWRIRRQDVGVCRPNSRWGAKLFVVASVLAMLTGIAAWAAEIPNALTNLVRGKTSDQEERSLGATRAYGAGKTEPPAVEFREVQSGPAGETGRLLTIDRSGQATLQTIPLGPGSKTGRTRLTCDELASLPQAMKEAFAFLQPSYGTERMVKRGVVSVVSRWDGSEKRVVWWNPESTPKPPQGHWTALVAPLEDIRRRAEEPEQTSSAVMDAIIGYNTMSEGIVGRYLTNLTVNKSGHAIVSEFGPSGPRYHETQLTPEELSALLRAFEEAKFADFQRCYGKHSDIPINRQYAYLFYHGDRIQNSVTWMNLSDPKPPDGWFRIVGLLDQIRARAEKATHGKPTTSSRP